MDFLVNQKYNLIWAITSIILIILVFNLNYYFPLPIIYETFINNNNVNIPLTTTYSCGNFCNPSAQCAITGQQCLADIDCPGCLQNNSILKDLSNNVIGENDAGKLTLGMTPQYSSLTNGYGTKELIITNNIYAKPPAPYFGENVWLSSNNDGQLLFDKRYKPQGLKYIPQYGKRYTFTGEFVDDGPIAANDYLL